MKEIKTFFQDKKIEPKPSQTVQLPWKSIFLVVKLFTHNIFYYNTYITFFESCDSFKIYMLSLQKNLNLLTFVTLKLNQPAYLCY